MGFTDNPIFYTAWFLNLGLLLLTFIAIAAPWFKAQHDDYVKNQIGVYVDGTKMDVCTFIDTDEYKTEYCSTYRWAEVDCEDDDKWQLAFGRRFLDDEDAALDYGEKLCNKMKHSAESAFTFSLFGFLMTLFNAWLISGRYHPLAEKDAAQNANVALSALTGLSMLIAVCAWIAFPTDNIIRDMVPQITSNDSLRGCSGGIDGREYFETAFNKLDLAGYFCAIIAIPVAFVNIPLLFLGGQKHMELNQAQKMTA